MKYSKKFFGSVKSTYFTTTDLEATNIDVTKATVTQGTNVTTTVTCNAHAGVITTHSSTSTGANSTSTFIVNNSKVLSTSVVIANVCHSSGNGRPTVTVKSVANGSFQVVLANMHDTDALNAAVKIAFIVV
jgi:DNA-directed RNA polymerase alpha subunit